MIEAEAVSLRNTVLVGGVGQAFDEPDEPVNPATEAALRVITRRRRVVGRRPRPGPRRGPAGAGQRPLHAGAGGTALLIAAAGCRGQDGGDEGRRHPALGHALPQGGARPGGPPAGHGGVGRRPPPHRQAAPAARRVRLHRRRRRGRAHAAQQQRRLRPHRVPATRAALGGVDRHRRPRCSAGRCRSR